MQGKRRCTACGEMRHPWEFNRENNHRLRTQCRACMNAKHVSQPSTTQGVRDGKSVIEARFMGAVPLGCVVPSSSEGKPPKVCPMYAHCTGLGPDDPVACEVSDAELNIPLLPKAPPRLKVEDDGPWWIADTGK